MLSHLLVWSARFIFRTRPNPLGGAVAETTELTSPLQLALKMHPDRNPPDKKEQAEKDFRENPRPEKPTGKTREAASTSLPHLHLVLSSS